MWKLENINQIFQTIKGRVITQLLKLYNRANTGDKWHGWAEMIQSRFSGPWRYNCSIISKIHAGSKTLSCLDRDQIFLTTTQRSRQQKIRIYVSEYVQREAFFLLDRISITTNQQTAVVNEDGGTKTAWTPRTSITQVSYDVQWPKPSKC